MFEQLKKIAQQEVMKRIAKNALGGAATNEAGEEGVNSIFATLQETLLSGKASQLTDLFSKGENVESGTNELVDKLKNQFKDVLQKKGLGEEEASADADNTIEGVINGLREKFASNSEEDKAFDLSDLANLAGGKGGNLFNKLKDLI